MAVFNTFTFDGENSLDYGVYITGEAVYNAPERAVEMVSIPGKNGALALDQGRFENIEVTYPAGAFGAEQAEFADRMRAMRNMLASRYNYVRLTDSYHPDEYRLGLYKNGLEVTPVAMSSAGEFDITFNCKPQRYLTSGEEPVDTSELGGEVTTDKIPYLFRRSGGGTIGHDFDAEIDKIIGGTVAWNQLCNSSSVTIPSGHKYYMVKGGSRSIGASSGTAITGLTSGTDIVCDLTQAFGTEIADYVYSLEQTTAGAGVAWLKSHGFLTKDYYAYDSGSLKSVKTSEHRTVGFNQWDEEWEVGDISGSTGQNTSASNLIRSKNYIPVLPNTVYCFTRPSVNIYLYKYDADKNFVPYGGTGYHTMTSGASTITIESGVCYVRFVLGSAYGTTYNHDICVNISKTTGSPKNGNYVAYDGHSYPLDSDLELRGLFKLDANNNLYAEGDVYESSGVVTRMYGIVDLGTLNWRYESGWNAFVTTISDAKRVPTSKANAICPLYISVGGHFSGDSASDMTMAINTGAHSEGTCTFRNTAYGTDAASFKTAMSGVYLVYELATPTTEQADPYANPQIVSPYGTEEYVDTRDVPVPVGHETKYGMSQLVLTNPTEFPSKPLLEVTGVGTFWLGDTLFTITGTAGQTIYIDCETGEAWKNTGGVITPANGLVTLNRLDFPELDPGDTPVMYGTGITKVVVTPRWWII